MLTCSIIISTYNRRETLRNCLAGLRGLRYPAFEVVVVNGPSTDGTAELVAAHAATVKLVDCPEQNLSMSRNLGIAAASGDILAFIDDDAVPHPDWLSHLVRNYEDSRIGGVGGFTIDNTGVRWQVKKTLCDRYGNAHIVADHIDERAFAKAGSPLYPSLLGTNSSFRASALRAIGGFDEVFAYLLDETDVCLRLIDAGWRLVYEPEALVFHQFAESHIRDSRRIARTLYPSAVSKGYFVERHGALANPARAEAEISRYREELLRSNAWFATHREISDARRHSLDLDLVQGLARGRQLARQRSGQPGGDLAPTEPPAFRPFPAPEGLRIAFVSRGFPPATDAGIARWTQLSAQELVKLGHAVHIITGAVGEAEEVRFEDGIWMHRVSDRAVAHAHLMLDLDLPPNISAWNKRVWQEVQKIRNFGLDVVSFPIWDLEGLACLGDPALPVVMSLHTSYAMARPFKPEWQERPLFGHLMVDRMIAAEGRAFATAPKLLANSTTIVRDLEAAYGVSVAPERYQVVPHGVDDLLAGGIASSAIGAERALRVLFVGRFEARKGFDLAVRAAGLLAAERLPLDIRFIGGTLDATAQAIIAAEAPGLEARPDVSFLGVVSRAELDDAYRACDVVLMPSRYESFGLVAAEAMSAGRPVIGLAAGALPEVVADGVDGFLVPDDAGAAKAIAAAIRRLHGDRALLRHLAAAARANYEAKFTNARMGQGLAEFFRGVVAAHSAETRPRP